MFSYTVRRGDSLGKIARHFYGDPGRYPLIVSANRIPDPDRLPVGLKLVIPALDVAQTGLGTPRRLAHLDPTPDHPHIGLSLQRLSKLHPTVRTRGVALIELCAQSGLAILVSQGLRTWEEQDALYAKGRTVPPIGRKHWVTMAKGGKSYHNFGLAFDIVVLDSVGKADWNPGHPGWATAGALGVSLGLEWGGSSRRFKDLPHFEYTGGLSLRECCDLYPAGLDQLWQRVV